MEVQHEINETVTAFWEDVWNAHDPDAVDRFVDDDIVVEIGGREVGVSPVDESGWF
jgi:hypothetical protein